MTESVYKFIEVGASSPVSWEKAAASAVKMAAKTLRDLRIAEVTAMDMQIDEKGNIINYRTRVRVSFKYEGGIGR